MHSVVTLPSSAFDFARFFYLDAAIGFPPDVVPVLTTGGQVSGTTIVQMSANVGNAPFVMPASGQLRGI